MEVNKVHVRFDCVTMVENNNLNQISLSLNDCKIMSRSHVAVTSKACSKSKVVTCYVSKVPLIFDQA